VALTSHDDGSFVKHHSTANHYQRPGRILRGLIAAHPADLWVLYEASKPVARFFRAAGTPAIVCGGPAQDEGLSVCGFDGTAALRHAIWVFIRAGHTRIVAPTRYMRPLREQAFCEEFQKRGLPFNRATHTPCWNDDLAQLHELLRTRLQSPDRPTAWIVSGLEALIAFFSCLAQLGLRVPDDVSLLCIGSDPMLGFFSPAIAHYATPHRTVALAMARMIRAHLQSPPPTPVRKFLQTEFVRGASVGPAP
jgi:DNA-binding LacI/PurR family transcriptional regulator